MDVSVRDLATRTEQEILFPRIELLLVLVSVVACFPCRAQNLSEARTEATSDFDLKFSHNDILVCRKGTDKWEHSRNVKESIQIELPDGSHAYLVTKAVEPPKPKHTPSADFPAQARREHLDGMVAVHAIVDEQGALRSVTVYSSTSSEFTTATMESFASGSLLPPNSTISQSRS
jgi:outer membrane biosynthesis protein TonB